MSNILISIVTPSFNQGEFIEEAIKSVQSQLPAGMVEHIIIDNCSTDQTKEVVAKYPHVVFVSEPDEGQSDAINKGFKIAKGQIIGWLNADDYYMPGTFDKVSSILSADDVHGIYSNVRFINKDNKFIKNLIVHKPVKWLSLFHCYIPSTSFFFKRVIIDEGLFIDKDMHISMDKDFFANIFYKGFKIKFVNDFFASFRWHDSNKSLDTADTKKLRHKEGLIIFNRYSRFNFSVSNSNVKRYSVVDGILLVYRKLLKVLNPLYNYQRLVKSQN